jgi:hypothetical protein
MTPSQLLNKLLLGARDKFESIDWRFDQLTSGQQVIWESQEKIDALKHFIETTFN